MGVLLNGDTMTLSVPLEKRTKALKLLDWAINKRKVTIHFIQKLTGTLNFLNRAIVPGRAFTRKMYYKLKLNDKNGFQLKQYHHVYLDKEFVEDCKVWKYFLNNLVSSKLCRPFLDWEKFKTSKLLNFYSDASGKIGMGAVYGNHYIVLEWNKTFIEKSKPSIEYLELYALVAAVVTWGPMLRDLRAIIFCDNQAMRDMINTGTASVLDCLTLVRLLVLQNLKWNSRIFIKYVESAKNILADSLSRKNFQEFWENAPDTMYKNPDPIPDWLLPPEKFWFKDLSKSLHFDF